MRKTKLYQVNEQTELETVQYPLFPKFVNQIFQKMESRSITEKLIISIQDMSEKFVG